MQQDTKVLEETNNQFENIERTNKAKTSASVDKTDNIANEITALIFQYDKLKGRENRYSKQDGLMARDMDDLVDYVKELTD